MSVLDDKLGEALSAHASRLAVREITDGFPLLHLNKSVQTYRIIATFLTLPPEERIEVAVACALRKTNEQNALWEAFRNRMEGCSLATPRLASAAR